jgi:iron complex outermembrane receptor protein
VDYRDRLLGIQQGPIILGNPTVLANVGSVRTRGAELAFGWKPTRWLDWFSAVTLNDSRFDDDYVTNGRTVAVDGLRLPDAPRTVLRSELTFDTGRVWARFIASHVGRRYYTYLNDGAAPAYTLFNLGLGVRLERLALQLDVRNLADKHYIATVGSADFAESDPAGTRQTLLTGAPRQYFVTLRSRF